MASVPPPAVAGPAGANLSVPSSSSLLDRVSKWVSDNKAIVYTIAGVAVVITGAGAVYYIQGSSGSKDDSKPRPSKKERRKQKQAEKQAETEKATAGAKDTSQPKTAVVDSAEELPEIDENSVLLLSDDERQKYSMKLKELGNKAYKAEEYDGAIDFYSKAILCKPTSIYYSNRAACYNAQGKWDKVIEDTTSAINLDPEYIKPLNRRANAYDHLGQYSEALLDYTASCIINGFKEEKSAQAVERLLKKFAETKAQEIMKTKPLKLPSPTFIGNYLQSFRVKPLPAGLEDAVDLPESTGNGQLQLGLRALEKKTSEGYEEAMNAFDKAVELNELGANAALAYNMRGTFKCLAGRHTEAFEDFNKSIELDPTMTQSLIKRASMHLELGNQEKAEEDFKMALQQNPEDPDIYYHRAQLQFIKQEYSEAAKDYQKSIDLDKDFIFSHIQLGVTQYKMGSIASAMATFRRCEKKFETTPDVYNYFGELLLDQNKFEEALQKFDKAIEMEKQTKPMSMNVLPLINKALALFQWKQDFKEAEKLCEKALIIDPECDIAVATMAQLLLQQGKVTDALTYFERAAEIARTEGELVNALSYAEATRTQIQVQQKYPKLAKQLSSMGQPMMR